MALALVLNKLTLQRIEKALLHDDSVV